MKLTVLCDNCTRVDAYYLAEPGVSYLLEDGDAKILFDTGYSDVYVRNAAKMGIDLTDLTALVLSHGHDDHIGGLIHLPQQGRKLLVSIVIHRFVQIQFVQRINDTLCHAMGKPCREGDGCESDGCQRLKHAQDQYKCSGTADRDTKHTSVIQSGRFVNRLFRQG